MFPIHKQNVICSYTWSIMEHKNTLVWLVWRAVFFWGSNCRRLCSFAPSTPNMACMGPTKKGCRQQVNHLIHVIFHYVEMCLSTLKENKEIPRPWGVHEYLTKDMGRNSNGVGATNGATMVEDSVQDTATWWRDVEVKRKFADDPVIYEEILQNTEWKASNARTRDFATGAYHLKYDQRGNIRWEGHQNGKYQPGLSPATDKILQKLFAEYGIADRTSGIITNWYPDGQGNLGSHRHDCWTALFSFGHERILTIDNTPLLMQDGDLCIFGTQRHGVPIMPEITEGRITLVVFFYPNDMQKKGQRVADPLVVNILALSTSINFLAGLYIRTITLSTYYYVYIYIYTYAYTHII